MLVHVKGLICVQEACSVFGYENWIIFCGLDMSLEIRCVVCEVFFEGLGPLSVPTAPWFLNPEIPKMFFFFSVEALC